jgi:hypothetical protein
MRISTVRDLREKATGVLRSRSPILVTRRGRLAGIYQRSRGEAPHRGADAYDMLSSDVAGQLRRRHVSEDDVLEDIAASRKKRRTSNGRRPRNRPGLETGNQPAAILAISRY